MTPVPRQKGVFGLYIKPSANKPVNERKSFVILRKDKIHRYAPIYGSISAYPMDLLDNQLIHGDIVLLDVSLTPKTAPYNGNILTEDDQDILALAEDLPIENISRPMRITRCNLAELQKQCFGPPPPGETITSRAKILHDLIPQLCYADQQSKSRNKAEILRVQLAQNELQLESSIMDPHVTLSFEVPLGQPTPGPGMGLLVALLVNGNQKQAFSGFCRSCIRRTQTTEVHVSLTMPCGVQFWATHHLQLNPWVEWLITEKKDSDSAQALMKFWETYIIPVLQKKEEDSFQGRIFRAMLGWEGQPVKPSNEDMERNPATLTYPIKRVPGGVTELRKQSNSIPQLKTEWFLMMPTRRPGNGDQEVADIIIEMLMQQQEEVIYSKPPSSPSKCLLP